MLIVAHVRARFCLTRRDYCAHCKRVRTEEASERRTLAFRSTWRGSNGLPTLTPLTLVNMGSLVSQKASPLRVMSFTHSE